MSVQLICDFCDEPITSERLTVTVPREMLPNPDGDAEEFEFHFHDWDCLRAVVNTGTEPDLPEDEPVPYVTVDAPSAAEAASSLHKKVQDEAFGSIQMHSTPMEQRRENKDVEVPMEGITRDRQPIVIRRK